MKRPSVRITYHSKKYGYLDCSAERARMREDVSNIPDYMRRHAICVECENPLGAGEEYLSVESDLGPCFFLCEKCFTKLYPSI